mgnify:CR=1 FL=1
MKTLKRKVLVVVFMLGTLLNYAGEKKEIDTKKVKLEFKNVKKGHFLTIKDKYGQILHTENISKKGNLTRTFDLSSLKEGNYLVELNKDFRILVKPFTVNSNVVIFHKNLERVIFKPVIRINKNRIYISKNAIDKKPVKIILYFNDNLIYTESITNEADIKRVFKLDKKEKGEYKAVVINNGGSYIEEFKI